MLRVVATTAAVAVTALAAIQFLPVQRRNSPAGGELTAPPEVTAALRGACYDCHSSQTRWPFYSAIAPISWLVAHDVNQGRRRLNFSDWNAYASDPQTAGQKLNRVAELVDRGAMAPWYYRLLHPGARLSGAQRRLIVQWARQQARSVDGVVTEVVH
jgi:hypothetical protein